MLRPATSLATAALVGLLSVADAGAQARRPKPAAAAANLEPAIADLASSDPGRAAKAAATLGQTRSPRAVDALLDALALGVHPDVAAAALEALAAQASIRAFDTASYYLSHRNTAVRVAAVKAVGALDDSRAAARVLRVLSDAREPVRAAAAEVVARRKLQKGVPALMKLLVKGDAAAAPALAALANPDLAREIGELLGSAPESLLARCLGDILMRADFGPETARVEVVRALGKLPGSETIEALSNYVESLPEQPVRQSRREAEAILEQRLTGGN